MFTITMKSKETLIEERSVLTPGEIEKFGGQTFEGFELKTKGVYKGYYRGPVNGNYVIFHKSEIAEIKEV